jgi:hypothetical protein
MSSIGTLVAGNTTSVSLNFIPQKIEVSDGAAITSLVVDTSDYGVILNLDQNGADDMGRLERLGADAVIRKWALATGQIPLSGQSCKITATLGAGANRELFQRSERTVAPMEAAIVRTSISQALDKSEITFEKFSYLGLRNLGTTDILNIVYENGHVETNLSPLQVQAMLIESMGGVIVPTLATMLSPSVIDNTNGIIRKITIIPNGANRNIYVRRLQAVSAISQR